MRINQTGVNVSVVITHVQSFCVTYAVCELLYKLLLTMVKHYPVTKIAAD
jgi:hypothetical protein